MFTISLIAVAALVIWLMTCCAVSPGRKDALAKATRALPASTTAVTSTAIDTGVSTDGSQPTEVEYLLSAPAVSQAQLPDGKTFTYAIVCSSSSDLSGPTTLIASAIVQTGSTGAAAATKRFKVPSTALRYVGFTVTPSASGTGDASGATATLEALA